MYNRRRGGTYYSHLCRHREFDASLAPYVKVHIFAHNKIDSEPVTSGNFYAFVSPRQRQRSQDRGMVLNLDDVIVLGDYIRLIIGVVRARARAFASRNSHDDSRAVSRNRDAILRESLLAPPVVVVVVAVAHDTVRSRV